MAGLVTYYVLFFLHLETRRVSLAAITRHPTEEWMTQMARNAVDEESGYLRRHRYVLHDRDTKFCANFRKTLATGGVKCLRLPPHSPNLKDYASHCTSFALPDVTSSAAPRSDSLWPWDLCGGLLPGAS